MAPLSRRALLSLLACPSSLLHSQTQGMASRGVKAVPRAKPSGLPFNAKFTDVAQQAGLKEIVVCGHLDRADYIVEVMSCGAAFFDYDNDGWLDIFVLSGSRVGDPPSDRLQPPLQEQPRRHVHRRHAKRPVSSQPAGPTASPSATTTTTASTISSSPTGARTCSIATTATARSPTSPNGRAAPTRSRASAPAAPSSTTTATATSISSSPTTSTFDIKTVPKPAETGACNYNGVPVNCGPRGLPYGRHSLYHNNGDGTFTDVTAASGIGKAAGGFGLTVVAADFDNDGWPDIYVACDSTPSLLFRNNHDGTFTEEGLDRGVALSEDGMEQAGMGLGIGDFNLDGSLDIVKTHFPDDTPVLYANDGKGNFRDVTMQAGLGVETRFVSWGAGIVDLDNDGHPDIFWVTGNVYPGGRKEVSQRAPQDAPRRLPQSRQRPVRGTDRSAGPGVDAAHSSRGCAFGDFDNDGDLDILIVNQNEPPSLLRNDVSGSNHWLKVKLRGVKSNRSAIGARVTVRYGGKVQVQEVQSQSSYLSVNDSVCTSDSARPPRPTSRSVGRSGWSRNSRA